MTSIDPDTPGTDTPRTDTSHTDTARTDASRTGTPRTDTSGTTEPPRRVPAVQAMRGAARQLGELLGAAPERVSALQPTQDGWLADVEMVELERVPETMTILATYRVTLDSQGQLLGYERQRRYARGQLDRGR
ncbi:gas vesicle protein GvpO [Streptomyces malaysiensis]|uniref:gas vesicle protein GvpO n=1 Tax=Streptomyces malaysiensis TaxID=92644 RepID=UPI0036CD5BCE